MKIFCYLTQENCKEKTACSQRKSDNRNITQPKQTFQSKAKANYTTASHMFESRFVSSLDMLS